MNLPARTHTLGPDDAKLTVRTGRKGAAAKAGHDLLIEVTAWQATLDVAQDPAQTTLTLSADARSFQVLDGTGGVQKLGDDDKAKIKQSIDDDVLKGCTIEFRSRSAEPSADGRMTVSGDLELFGDQRPVAFELAIAEDGRLTGAATVKHSDWGVKPYSAMFGALKVADEVRIEVDGRVPSN
jgi:polyisoprenoid-binding protein YceI